MYLREIEITGFKSFAKKSTLSFSRPVTAIVGPNGSGKSNVVEAMRFALGEQSMKSMRGKSGTDLIFKGSKLLQKLSRASVSISFDNSKKIFKFPSGEKNGISLDFDTITITREVYADGVSRYLLNGSEVRLKDVLELLSSINIGATGHHIISQGEADRLLSASSRDRREMIEDALGLKIYQYRLKDADRKIGKTRENIKEVSAQKRELAPRITFLARQVEKIEKAKVLREELGVLYGEYFAREDQYIGREEETLQNALKVLTEELGVVEKALESIATDERDMGSDVELHRVADERGLLRRSYDELSRKVGRIEALIDVSREAVPSLHTEAEPPIPRGEVKQLIDEIERLIDFVLSKTNIHDIFPTLKKIKEASQSFREKLGQNESGQEIVDDSTEKIATLEKERALLLEGLNEIEVKEGELLLREKSIREKFEASFRDRREKESKRYELLTERNRLQSEKEKIGYRQEVLTKIKTDFEEELREASVLLGAHMVSYKRDAVLVEEERQIQEDRRKKIERIKIKLEEAGIGGAGEIMKEYEEVVERDQFLAHELDDLVGAMNSLEVLIKDLKDKLDIDFKTGVEKINTEFQKFFSLMFGGGSAFLSIVVEKPRKKRGVEEDEEEEMEVDEDERFEQGIEINISLPHKKVRELAMLSGGERSLTSIALLFAITQVNPPPFLVLDETDAALDESNSRRYGDMIVELSKVSQLVVVTHNRETMSRADTIYGVTVGADGGSKLLSIQFEEAAQIAK